MTTLPEPAELQNLILRLILHTRQIKVKQANSLQNFVGHPAVLHFGNQDQGGLAYHVQSGSMAQQQQQQSQQQPAQVDPQQNPPSKEELRDYKLGMERPTAEFRVSVHAQGIQAYVELIHAIRITSCKLVSDLLNADEGKVLKVIRRSDGHHFKAGSIIHTRASSSRTYSPDFSTEEFDDTTNKLISELHLRSNRGLYEDVRHPHQDCHPQNKG